MIQFDKHIFQMGWNHQLGRVCWKSKGPPSSQDAVGRWCVVPPRWNSWAEGRRLGHCWEKMGEGEEHWNGKDIINIIIMIIIIIIMIIIMMMIIIIHLHLLSLGVERLRPRGSCRAQQCAGGQRGAAAARGEGSPVEARWAFFKTSPSKRDYRIL